MKQILYSVQKHARKLLMALACGAAFTACSNILDNGYDDCFFEYRVKFKYDYNMKYADAFPKEVRSVDLYVFDKGGHFIAQQSERGDILAANGYTMLLDLEPGDYHFVTWAGLEGQESFTVPELTPGVSTLEELTCQMKRNTHPAEGTDSVGYLKPLWHGQVDATLPRITTGTETITIPLVKNTNTLRIILQQLTDGMVDVRHYEYRVTDDNGWMNHDNALLPDDTLTYYPYYKAQGSADIEGGSLNELNMGVVELSMGRLMTNHRPRLTITHRDEPTDTLLSIPLVEYFELCKMLGHAEMGTQEYLDREDEYNMTFFLDSGNRWLKTQIVINDWVVRYNDITPEM